MSYKDKIISACAKKACEKVSRKVIRELREMTEGLQLGDDSSLKTIWDEVCVQVQDQYSGCWNSYLDTIEGIIRRELERLDGETLCCIWLQTDQGSDWETDIECKIDDGEIKGYETEAEYNMDDITQYILGAFVLSAADDYSNKRIEKYLARPSD